MFDVIPTNNQTWLVCGGRDFTDINMFNSAMGDLIRLKGIPEAIVHGAARGADSMADEWAKRHAVIIHAEKADWNAHGRSAGVIRNQAMLDKFRPSLVIAFPGGRGTADMVARAKRMSVDTAEIKPVEKARGEDERAG